MPRGVHNGTGRGGRRPSVASPAEVTVSLSPAQRYFASQIGNGNVSQGIRDTLRAAVVESGSVYIDVLHPTLGACILTTDHSASSYGQPVLVPASDFSAVYEPGEVPEGAFTEPIPGAWPEPDRAALEGWASSAHPFGWSIGQ